MFTPEEEIELQAACTCETREAKELLKQNTSWLKRVFDLTDKPNFRFTEYQLLSYLRHRPELCNKILQLSYDKRSTPSTFVEEYQDKYRVGWFDKDRAQVKVFDKLHDAVTDFVLFSWGMKRLNLIQYRLPEQVRKKSVECENEVGWHEKDFVEAVEAARQIKLATIGGQVQYHFPDGTCELYWLSYDSTERRVGENWVDYCNRSATECIDKFKTLIATKDIEKEALEWDFIRAKKNSGVNINDFKTFILYFSDDETNSQN